MERLYHVDRALELGVSRGDGRPLLGALLRCCLPRRARGEHWVEGGEGSRTGKESNPAHRWENARLPAQEEHATIVYAIVLLERQGAPSRGVEVRVPTFEVRRLTFDVRHG